MVRAALLHLNLQLNPLRAPSLQRPRHISHSSLVFRLCLYTSASLSRLSMHSRLSIHSRLGRLISKRSRGSAESAIVSFETVMATTATQSAQPVTSLPGNKPLSSSKHWPVQMLKNLIQQLRQHCMHKSDMHIHSRQQVDNVERFSVLATAAFCAVPQQPTAQQGRPTTTANMQVGGLKHCTVANQIGAGHTWITLFFHLGQLPVCRHNQHRVLF